jgi:non-lysosomal glucosylceramidase
VWADQFAVFVQRHGQEGQAQVLCPARPPGDELQAWRWDMPAACATYYALYPRAWTVYDQPLPGIRLTCRQLSPVIPHNYRESSYPVGQFLWRVENLADTEAVVGLMATWQNGMGTANDRAGGHANSPFGEAIAQAEMAGVALRHQYRQGQAYALDQVPKRQRVFEDPLTFALAAQAGSGAEISCRSQFISSGSGEDVWQDFAQDGRLEDRSDRRPSAQGETIAAAVAATVTIPAGGQAEIAFALAWDMPVVRSGFGTAYHPRYTRFYGHGGDAAPQLARDTLLNAPAWEAAIVAWQQPILDDPQLPDWYKMALFNELYYLVDGGTLWVYPADQPAPQSSGPDSAPDEEDLGRFAYLESHEYRMYNTYDVHFYASFALASLWPRLELALQRDIAAATLMEIEDTFTPLWTGGRAQRKVPGAVPHDIGWPDEDPWRLVNGYFLHDTNQWKDLNPKFVLQVYRDYVLTGDRQFVSDVWPAIEAAVAYVRQFDRDGDGLIENDGEPDQTYDTWPVVGASAYTGGLWLAALSAATALAELMDRSELAADYHRALARGQAAYQARLWNGRYFNYDSSPSRHNDSIMADQLAGQWYARACGLPSIVEDDQVKSALRTVHEFNVRRFAGGQRGAVNGMRPNGRVDTTSMQSQEVWPGTTYAVAAAMLQEGLVEEALATAKGAVRTTFVDRGYWFQTPEAWDRNGNYRAIAYMRPLAIWAMQWAWERSRVGRS